MYLLQRAKYNITSREASAVSSLHVQTLPIQRPIVPHQRIPLPPSARVSCEGWTGLAKQMDALPHRDSSWRGHCSLVSPSTIPKYTRLPARPCISFFPYASASTLRLSSLHQIHNFKNYVRGVCPLSLKALLKQPRPAPRHFPLWSCGRRRLAFRIKALCRTWRTPSCRPCPAGSR